MSVASRPVSTARRAPVRTARRRSSKASVSARAACITCASTPKQRSDRWRLAPALRVEGIIRHPALEQPLEYFVIIAIRNDRGEEVTRQVVNVGALQAAEKRTFTLSVEVLPPQAPVPPAKTNSSTGTYKTPTVSAPQPPSPPPQPSPQAQPKPAAPPATSSAPPKPASPPPPSGARPATPGSSAGARQPLNPTAPGAPQHAQGDRTEYRCLHQSCESGQRVCPQAAESRRTQAPLTHTGSALYSAKYIATGAWEP